MEVNMDTSPNMAEGTAMEDIKNNTMVIVTEDSMAEVIKAMEGDTKLKDTNPNMEVVMAMSLQCTEAMNSRLTEDMKHRLMEVTRLPCMAAMNSRLTEDMKHRLMEATNPWGMELLPTEVPDMEVIPWVTEAFLPLRFLRMTKLKPQTFLRLSQN